MHSRRRPAWARLVLTSGILEGSVAAAAPRAAGVKGAQAKAAGIELRIASAPLNTLLTQRRNGDYNVDVLQ